MDPDGLIFAITCLASCIFALWLGAYSAGDNEKQAHEKIGFGYTQLGLGVLLFICCGFSYIFFNKLIIAHTEPSIIPLSAAIGLIKGGVFLLYCILFLAALVIICAVMLALGIYKSEKVLKFGLTRFFGAVSHGIGLVLALPTILIFKAAKIDAAEDITEEDVLNMVDSLVDSEEDESGVDETQKDMISGVFELDDVTAGEIMTHRTDMVAVNENTPINDILKPGATEGRSRLPVYSQSVDNIVGILYVKDLLAAVNRPDRDTLTVKQFMRSAMFVPEVCRARELLLDFKAKHTQIAIVVDEYGGTSGIVTMEDILEEIVGNIQDEFDNEEELITKVDDGVICDASVDVEDLFKALGAPVPELSEDEDFESVSGLINDNLGRIPLENENIELDWHGVHFKVLQVGERRILKVKCTLLPTDEKERD